MKLNAVIVHSTDANIIITFISIEVGSSPADQCIRDMRRAHLLIRAWAVGCRRSHGEQLGSLPEQCSEHLPDHRPEHGSGTR
jgi:hypothetical protein